MDANKLKKLQEIEYKVLKCCSICEYSNLGIRGWGTCMLHTYEHLKHTKSTRDLSIVSSGWCNKFKICETLDLHGFKELIKDE